MSLKQSSFWLFIVLIGGNVFAALGDVVLKVFGDGQNTYQYLFLRQTLLLLLIFPFWWRQSNLERSPGTLKVHVFRAVISVIGGATTLYALVNMPLSSANIVFYACPLITIVFARVLFSEQLIARRIAVLVIGFFGVVIALRPEQFNLAAGAALITAAAISLFNLSVRWLPSQVTTTSTVFWTTLCCWPICLLLALPEWQPINPDLIFLSAGTCLCYWLYHITCVRAYKQASVGGVVVAEYSGLLFAFVFGYSIFDERFAWHTIAGMTIIVVSLTVHGLLERRHSKLGK